MSEAKEKKGVKIAGKRYKVEKSKEYKPYKDGYRKHTKVYNITKYIDDDGNIIKKKSTFARILKNFTKKG